MLERLILFARAGGGLTEMPPLHSVDDVWTAVALYISLVLAGLVLCVVMGVHVMREPGNWGLRETVLSSRLWTWRDAGIMLAVFLFFYLLMPRIMILVAGLAGTTITADDKWFDVFCGAVLYLCGLGIIVGMLVRRRSNLGAAFGISRRSSWRNLGWGVVFYVAAMPFFFITSLAFQAFLRLTGRTVDVQESIMTFVNAGSIPERVLFILLAVVGAPLFEECVFRGIILPLFTRRMGLGAAITLSSILFAAIHLHFASFAVLFVLSVAFSLAYAYTGSLLVPMTMHALFNGMNLLMVLLAFDV